MVFPELHMCIRREDKTVYCSIDFNSQNLEAVDRGNV